MAITKELIGIKNGIKPLKEQKRSLQVLNNDCRITMGHAWNRVALEGREEERASNIMLIADYAANAPGALEELKRWNEAQHRQQPWSDTEGAKRIDALFRDPPKRLGSPIEVLSALPKGK